MAGHYEEHPPSSYLNVGHHAFVQAAQPDGATSRPQSRGREPSPMGRRASAFGLNILKMRNRTSTSPDFSDSRDASPHPHSRKGSAAPPLPSMAAGLPNGDPRGRQPSLHMLGRLDQLEPGDPLSPLPLPPTIPGARGLSSNRSGSRERPGTSGSTTGSGSRPGTPGSLSSQGGLSRPGTPSDEKKSKRKTFFSGAKLQKKDKSSANATEAFDAFVMRPEGKDRYDLGPLLRGQPVTELWDNSGNLFVHLYPNSNPSFRLDSSVIASAKGLQNLIQTRRRQMSPSTHMRHVSLGNVLGPAGSRHARSSSVGSMDSPWSPTFDDEPAEMHLHMPIMVDRNDPAPEDITMILTIRNMFAVLIGQLIVGNHKMPTIFSIFNHVAAMMRKYEFGNFDCSTMGEAAEAAFLGYVADLRLDDVRKSREKTMEALILGERMKCWPLYNEAYVHGVGKWNEIVAMRSPLFDMISPRTRSAMEKSAIDLENRLRTLRTHLDNFEWPGLFAGFMNSTSVKKSVAVDAWKNAWVGLRKHVLNHYKKQYGNWPPKAKSKKNDFDESGLNRALLQSVFQDFTDLYDLLVNREALTERTVDSTHGDTLSEDTNEDVLRKLLSEFDRSLVPVRPPIPYDLPKLPNASALEAYTTVANAKKADKASTKKLKDNDLTLVQMDSYNRDALKKSDFLESFMDYERSLAKGKTPSEMADIRIGQWVFLYVVLQMLPLLVVDAPGLRWTKGVEYYLCEVPRSTPPWMSERHDQKSYYRVASTGAVVSMSSDVVEHGIEGIYRRSHCWVAASRWSGRDADALIAGTAGMGDHLPHSAPHSDRGSRISSVSGPSFTGQPSFGVENVDAPISVGSGGHLGTPADGMLSAGNSGAMRVGNRSSFMPGLEALPMPPSLGMDGISVSKRRQSTFDPTASFDAILGSMDQDNKEKEKEKTIKKKGKK